MCDCWYHAELNQACAEQLLIHDGRDGAFLVRQSESLHGAFAICLMYQHQVHSYRVLPDENGLLSVQSVQGVELKKFPGLVELISAYARKGNGLMTALQHPVGQKGVDTEAHTDDDGWNCLCCKDFIYVNSRNDLSGWAASNSTHNTILDGRQSNRRQDQGQCALSIELEKECKHLDRKIKTTWYSLKILAEVFGHVCTVSLPDGDQISALDNLIHTISGILQLLSSLENKTIQIIQECVTCSPTSPASHISPSPKMSMAGPGNKTSRERGSVSEKLKDQNQPRRSALQNLSLFIGTWNMGGSSPPRSFSSWLSARQLEGSLDNAAVCVSYDLYMIGTQENPQGDREWAELLRTALISHTMKEYKMVCVHSLGGIKLVLLVKEEYEYLITHVQSSTVRTGITNTLGIRGAVGVSLEFNGTSLGFVTCHLVSGIEKVQKRNQSFGEILRGLMLGNETLRGFQLPLRLTHLFWAGDLNYKLDMPVQDVLQCIYSGQHQLLFPVDQLNQERERKKIFLGFKEEPITFPPTCRYERGSRMYDLQKTKTTGTRIFAPSWSDRILWTSYPDTEVQCTSYGCTDDIVTSDHSPIFATFEVGLNVLSQRDFIYTLRFQSIEAIIKTQSRSRGYIKFTSLCLRGSPQSSVNSVHSTEGTAFVKLGWLEQDLPEVTLVGEGTNSAFTEHLLLSIQSTDGGESFGISVTAGRGNRIPTWTGESESPPGNQSREEPQHAVENS
ncbi:phosphatidylinositol 3,4,5-trisphosphate 5-phosphatase 2A-like isoform X2 [Mixophyes fleayi]|uniref:phosphatidylinositol 3,4,5-trisphosphate 5-phosphatase 2A-like isoform X2 n=1 Tax=Mixophyes fleayi TaxID=3061075 RepID=UPI003F4DCB1C